ncbi:helix-turn-helix domain-containing protein [Polaribacter vadi]|uniref:helix-turn-helix domain-containing protein n=1 Tax=Polaribacter TaxID=52959 RepID=UPI001C09F1B8|nr:MULTISPECIES: helix-turn-helix domain-containing protein [Polaribacter]MBU3010691.1 helix-turn-helix domain-containing protein [Polaribacter vadi]MDO6740502.1 helix-turn-helix domain-containing protein [Polaribacter sp. 1_MG-2023]
MSQISKKGKFIEQAEVFVLEHISNEQFGVSELAMLMHMSRSNLLRKIKKETELSASQFIRQVRLEKGKELLEETELTVSEISYQVGFSNNSYFIKCFREQYGLSPGEYRVKPVQETEIEFEDNQSEIVIDDITESFFKKYRTTIFVAAFFTIVVATLLFFKNKTPNSEIKVNESKKSIAVLPFKNMSSDSTNLYFVNGLMESALNNLQKIEDLRVISRTSVEKYRNTNKTVKEIAEELNVAYLLEGSGQRINDQVLLNIQLIDASKDTPIWAQQYNNKVVDVFSLQNTVAKKIVDAIHAKVTPAEFQQINKKPTENLEAYEFYLKGLVPLKKETKEGLKEAIALFEKAIELDPKFALAYSDLAIAYYYLDINQRKKQYTEIINNYADKALLYDNKSSKSLIAKALYYININEFRLAIPHLEKALEYNPNSSSVVQILADLYSRAIPNTGKYLKYALMGLQLDVDSNDATAKGFMYLALSNALIQNGFINEAQKYINLSLASDPNNYYAPFLKVFIDYAQHQDLNKATNSLKKEFKKDTTRLDLMQEVAKFYYFQENYDSAFYYYDKFQKIRKKNGLNMYPQENLKIGLVFDKMGLHQQALEFYKTYDDYCKNDQSIYKSASLATKYIHEGKNDLAIEQFKLFATKNNYQYWVLLFLEKDPLIKSLQTHPEYDEVIQKIRDRFWDNHNQLKESLKENGLI